MHFDVFGILSRQQERRRGKRREAKAWEGLREGKGICGNGGDLQGAGGVGWEEGDGDVECKWGAAMARAKEAAARATGGGG